ncbi:MAG: GPR endopeptidase [Lachnospiraceae bacterium]|nr:GPR endopeptidase [Lachnospiraceae bacterium]
MEGQYEVRTDLALEASESLKTREGHLNGVSVEEKKVPEVDAVITKVQIETKNAAKRMGKPVGTYITMEVPGLAEDDTGFHDKISKLLAEQIRELLGQEEKLEEKSIMIVGLGNRAVTADALGPKVIDHLSVTRHILNTYGKEAYTKAVPSISAMEPGVMAKTGIETSEMVAGVVKNTNPDCLIVIDALAARSTKRLYTTIQISNTGISPGSGVGNHRNAINEEVMGVPVLAIGIPTVVDAATIVGDACEAWWHESLKEPGPFPEEVRKYFRDLKNMYVTTKEIDEIVECISYTVSEALNSALHGTI